jgi:hypothetical protein
LSLFAHRFSVYPIQWYALGIAHRVNRASSLYQADAVKITIDSTALTRS